MIDLEVSNKEQVILQDKINSRIETAEGRIKPILDTIEREGSLMHDFVAPLGKSDIIRFESNGSLKLDASTTTGDTRTYRKYKLHTHAVGQAGEKLGIPTGYIKKLAIGDKWQRDLAADVLNRHSEFTDRRKILVRAVGDEVRGILSDHYRRLNTSQIYSVFFNQCNRQGAKIVDAHVDATRTYCETVYPKVISVPTQKNGTVHMVFGLRISNSDFGDGALQLQAYNMQVVCLNGMTRDNMLRQIHLGRQLPDDLSLSQRTYDLDTETQASLIEDLVKNSFNAQNIERQARIIQLASEREVDLNNEINGLKRLGLFKHEVDEIEDVLIASKQSDGVQGEGTLWKLSQAVTAVARDQENKRRQREIEEISGKLFNRIKLND
jgi:hypothetical protein